MHPKYKKQLMLIILFGLFLRVVFTLFGAEIYYNKADFYYRGDTESYTQAAKNLVNHGKYQIPLDEPGFSTGRTPGYPIFITFFYVLSGKNVDITYQLLIWIQVLLDVLAIFLLFSIARKIFNSQRVGLVMAALYASYPFVIVWTPVITSEAFGTVMLILSLYYLTKATK